MRKLLVANYMAIFFLLFLVIAGTVTTISHHQKYGFEYVVTTITNGQETTRTVTVWENTISLATFALLALLILTNTIELRELPKSL